MSEFWEVILDALIDTAKILPLLFVAYYLIELIEYKFAASFQRNKILKGKASPIFGAVFGCVPQCGFSVISTDLFSRKMVSVGALIAVYIATSDEAIPIMIANPSSIPYMTALLLIKIVFGIAIGYLSMLLYKLIFKKKLEVPQHNHEGDHDEDEHEEHSIIEHGGCCHHHVESKSFDWLHPMLHCLKISAFILVINIILGFVTRVDSLMSFMEKGKFLQPILAVIIGLIPNCASSVALTELFISGGLNFGALVAGLCVNAGLGLVVLFKENKNWKENLFIILMLIVPSMLLGYALIFI